MIEFEDSVEREKRMCIAKDSSVNLTLLDSQFTFQRLVEKGRFGVFMADTKGYLFYVNHVFVTLLGYTIKDEILGMNLGELLFKNLEKREDFLRRLNQTSFVKDLELKFIRKDGIDSTLSVSAKFNEDNDGKVVGVDGFMLDVTEKNQLEEDLTTEKSKLEQILEFSEAIGLIKDFDELMNNVVERICKVLEAQKCSIMLLDDEKKMLTVVGAKGMKESVVSEIRMEVGKPIAGVVAGEGYPLLVKNIEYDHKFQRANKPDYLGRSFMVVPIKLRNEVIGVINVSDKILKKNLDKGSKLNYEEVFDDIDLRILSAITREIAGAIENVKLFKELNSLAVTDPLTHIYNYRQFSESLEYEIKRCRRNERSLCMIMIDLDDFKIYNDSFGHQEGDELLRNLGKIFKEQLREVDIVCRYAGDEFAIILPDTNSKGAKLAAQKIKIAVSDFSFKKDVTLSFGIAQFNNKLTQYELIQHADQALYRAKEAGKNSIRVY